LQQEYCVVVTSELVFSSSAVLAFSSSSDAVGVYALIWLQLPVGNSRLDALLPELPRPIL
jgi:hypothetical protein